MNPFYPQQWRLQSIAAIEKRKIMFSFLNEFPQIFAERLYDEPNIGSKFFKQGSQGKRGVTY